MADSERPSITGESKRQMQERHQRELVESGYGSRIKQWGAVAGAIVAIFSLGAVFSQQVWPWCVRAALGETLEVVRKNTEASDRLSENLKKQTDLLTATIKAVGEHVQAGAVQDEKLRGSIEALRNEVRLRHNALDVGEVAGLSGYGSGGGGSGVSRGSGGSSASTASRPPTRQQQLQVMVQQADDNLEQAKKAAPPKKAGFEDAIRAKLH